MTNALLSGFYEGRLSHVRGRHRRKIIQYFVKWQGCPDEDNTWLDEEDIHEDLIAAYHGN